MVTVQILVLHLIDICWQNLNLIQCTIVYRQVGLDFKQSGLDFRQVGPESLSAALKPTAVNSLKRIDTLITHKCPYTLTINKTQFTHTFEQLITNKCIYQLNKLKHTNHSPYLHTLLNIYTQCLNHTPHEHLCGIKNTKKITQTSFKNIQTSSKIHKHPVNLHKDTLKIRKHLLKLHKRPLKIHKHPLKLHKRPLKIYKHTHKNSISQKYTQTN